MKDVAPYSRKAQPFKIIVVNDEPGPLEMFETLIRRWFKDSDLLLFLSGPEAWQELSRADPDILITDDRMPGLGGEEICNRLLARKAAYPIIVNSAWEPTAQWVRQCADEGLNVRFLERPFRVEEFRKVLEASLRISLDNNNGEESTSVNGENKTPVFDPELWGQSKEQVEEMEGKFSKWKARMNSKSAEQNVEAVDSSTLYRMVAPGRFAQVKEQPAKANLLKLLWHPKTIVAVGAIAFALVGLFPPWLRILDYSGSLSTHSQYDAGYSFICFPPSAKPMSRRNIFDDFYYGIQIDTSRLAVEWLCILIVTGAALFIQRGETSKPHDSKVA